MLRKKNNKTPNGEDKNSQQSSFMVMDLPESDRPRERLLERGPGSLTDSELIAILLRTGTKGISVVDLARKLSASAPLEELFTKSLEFFTQFQGIGDDKAATLLAAFELCRRIQSRSNDATGVVIREPSMIAKMLIPLLRDEKQEVFGIVCISSSGMVLPGGNRGFITITRGTLDSSLAPPREVIKTALEKNAKKIVLVHNHPSGNLSASQSDKDSTKRIKEAAQLFSIDVIDHFIIGNNGYFSFAEQNLLP